MFFNYFNDEKFVILRRFALLFCKGFKGSNVSRKTISGIKETDELLKFVKNL